MSSLNRSIRTLGVLLPFGLLATPASAATFCATTGNALSTALVTAAANGVDDEIRIASGTMQRTGAVFGNPRWFYDPADSDATTAVVVSGGWNATCTTQTLDPDLTVLDAEFQGTGFRVLPSGVYAGDVTIANLTMTRGYAQVSGEAANLNVTIASGAGSTFTLERTVIVAGSAVASAAVGGARISASDAVVRVRNNIVSFNNGPITGALAVGAFGATIAYVANNTVLENTSTANGSTAGVQVSGPVYLANNAFHGNHLAGVGTLYDFVASTGVVTLRDNHFGAYKTVQVPVESGTTTGDPMWTVVGVYPIPDAGSPLRDSGLNSPLGGVGAVDVAGHPRVVNATIDRGAVEAAAAPQLPDAVFGDGFE